MSDKITDRYRGPFKLFVVRCGEPKTKPRSQWLPGEVDGADLEDEARMLLGDPRDAIARVTVWSIRLQQFIFTYDGGAR